jgi:hypothetical protein
MTKSQDVVASFALGRSGYHASIEDPGDGAAAECYAIGVKSPPLIAPRRHDRPRPLA